jgi:hypothetical protein
MYHIDGLIVDGKIVVSYPFKYIGHCHEVTSPLKNFYSISSIMLDYDNPLTKELINYAKKVLLALPTPKNTAFHLELFLEHNTGELVFCEIASRVGGGYIREILIDAFGVDLGTDHIRLSAGLVPRCSGKSIPDKPKKISGWTMFPDQKGYIEKLPTTPEFPWVEFYNCTSKVGDIKNDATNVLDELASVHFSGNTSNDLEHKVKILTDWFYSNFTLKQIDA